MLSNDPASKLVQDILARKTEIESQGKKPRLVLIGDEAFTLLEADWIKAATDLPWGDSLVYELRLRRLQRGTIFLGDGSIFGLWVVRVSTIEGFQVF